MTSCDWYNVLKDFASPVATLVAAVAATIITVLFGLSQRRIAKQQAETAKIQAAIAFDKLKHDLFLQRYKIYSTAKSLIELVVSPKLQGKRNPAEIREHYITLDESRFLFSAEIQKYLSALQTIVEEFITLEFGRVDLAQENDEESDLMWQKTGEDLAMLSSRLRGIYADLPKVFEDSLAFRQITDQGR